MILLRASRGLVVFQIVVLDRYRSRGYGLGWRIPVDFSDGACRDLHALADGDFPYTPLRIAVADPPDILTWPHLER